MDISYYIHSIISQYIIYQLWSKRLVFEALTCWPMRMPTLSAARFPRGRLHVPWQIYQMLVSGLSCYHVIYKYILCICIYLYIYIYVYVCIYGYMNIIYVYVRFHHVLIMLLSNMSRLYSLMLIFQFVLDAVYSGFQRFHVTPSSTTYYQSQNPCSLVI